MTATTPKAHAGGSGDCLTVPAGGACPLDLFAGMGTRDVQSLGLRVQARRGLNP